MSALIQKFEGLEHFSLFLNTFTVQEIFCLRFASFWLINIINKYQQIITYKRHKISFSEIEILRGRQAQWSSCQLIELQSWRSAVRILARECLFTYQKPNSSINDAEKVNHFEIEHQNKKSDFKRGQAFFH